MTAEQPSVEALHAETVEWLARSRDSKSPSAAKVHAERILAVLDSLTAALERAERKLNVVIRDDEGDPLTVWFEAEDEMVAFIHLWDAVQRTEARAQKAEAELAAMIAIISDAFLAAKAALDEPPTEGKS